MLHKANQMPPVLTSSNMQIPLQDSINSNIPLPVPAPQPVPPVSMLSSNFPLSAGQDIDLRNVIDPRMNRNMDQDMRSIPQVSVPIPNPLDPAYQRSQQQQAAQRTASLATTFQSDPRQRPVDPRVKQMPQQPIPQPQGGGASGLAAATAAAVSVSAGGGGQNQRLPNAIPSNASDQEKAALIMQVLQLSDEQIAILPPEQRASILVLKEQIAKTTQQR